MTRLTRRVAPLSLLSTIALMAGCAVAAPAPLESSGPGRTGKADGVSACNEAELALISCAAEHCTEDDSEECVTTNCAAVTVEIGAQCGECIESYYGDLEVAADRCSVTPAAAGPCADDLALIECAVANCEGLSGDALIECFDSTCEAEAEDTAPLCAQCIVESGQAGTEALMACAQSASPQQCGAEESDAVLACAATNCEGLVGDEFNECLTTACEAEVRGLNPVCVQCVGGGLDAGAPFDETVTACRGTDGPAEDSTAVCSYEEISDVLDCGEAHCGDLTGEALNECLDASCGDVFEAAAGTLSDACGRCFIYSTESGADLAATRSACVQPAEE